MKEWKEKLIIILIVLAFLGSLFLIISDNIKKTNELEETIQRCQSKGWDGAKFKSGVSSEMYCLNITQGERDAKSEEGE